MNGTSNMYRRFANERDRIAANYEAAAKQCKQRGFAALAIANARAARRNRADARKFREGANK